MPAVASVDQSWSVEHEMDMSSTRTYDRPMSHSMRIALGGVDKALLSLSKPLSQMAAVLHVRATVFQAPPPPLIRESTFQARVLPEVRETLLQAAVPEVGKKLTQLQFAENTKGLRQAIAAMSELGKMQLQLQFALNAKELRQAIAAMSEVGKMQSQLQFAPNARELRQAITAIPSQSKWQEALASFADASELQGVLPEWSQNDDAMESPDSRYESFDDANNELTSVDRRKLEFFLILLVLLPRVAPKLDAAVVADLLRWIVEVAIELSSGQ